MIIMYVDFRRANIGINSNTAEYFYLKALTEGLTSE